jgi:hypothetical protein
MGCGRLKFAMTKSLEKRKGSESQTISAAVPVLHYLQKLEDDKCSKLRICLSKGHDQITY